MFLSFCLIFLSIIIVTSAKAYQTNITVNSIPSCHSSQSLGQSVHQKFIMTINLKQNIHQIPNFTIAIRSNMPISIKINQDHICKQKQECLLQISSLQVQNGEIVVNLEVIYKQSKQPIIFCLKYQHQPTQIIRPLKKSNIYTYSSFNPHLEVMRNERPISGQFYLLKPYAQSLKAYFSIEQGYPIIIPYQCPQYSLSLCLQSLYNTISEVNQEIRTNYYMALTKIILSRKQQISIDYCTNCYWVIYMDCKIKQCEVSFKFDSSIKPQTNIYENNIELQSTMLIKQNRFHTPHVTNKQDQGYLYRAYTDSQLINYSQMSFGQLYLSCQHLLQTYVYRIRPATNTIIIIKRTNNTGELINCEVKLNAVNEKSSEFYHSNLFYHNIYLNKLYPTILTNQYSGFYIYQFPHNQNQIYINIKTCSSTPLTMQYYFVPDYEAIKNRNKTEDEEDQLDDIQNWITRRQVRVTTHLISKQISRVRNIYFTNYLIIQLHSDSTSYIQFSISKQKKYQPNQKQVQTLTLFNESYGEQNLNKIKFSIQIKVLTETSQEQLAKIVQVFHSSSQDNLELAVFCSNSVFEYPQYTSLKPQQITNLSITKCSHENNNSYICISGSSDQQYLGITLYSNNKVYHKVVDLKTKVNFIGKYLWIFVFSAICSLLILIGMILLLKTAPVPKKPQNNDNSQSQNTEKQQKMA